MIQESFTKYNELAQNAINELITDFRTHPFAFIYEADLQSHLYAKLHRKFELIGNPVKIYDGIIGSTKLFHTETRIGRQHLDVAIWDDEPSEFCKADYKRKPVSIAVEIKYDFKTSFRNNNYRGIEDIRRLRDYFRGKDNCKGYALWFVAGLRQLEQLQRISYDLAKRCTAHVDSYLVGVSHQNEDGSCQSQVWLNGKEHHT